MGWIRRGPRYSTRKTVRQAIWGPDGERLDCGGGGGEGELKGEGE